MTSAQIARRFARIYTAAVTDVMGVVPLSAYEQYGAF